MKKLIKKLIPSRLKKYLRKRFETTVYVHNTKKPYILCNSSKMPLQGQVAIVTGGSGALGRAICLRLASEGAYVYVVGRNKEALESVVCEIRNLNFNANYISVDITNAQAVKAAFSSIAKIDIFVNCAGGSARENSTLLAEQSESVMMNVIDTNLKGTMLCCKEALSNMYQHGYGRLINISSTIGIQGLARYSDYAAAKAGIIGITKSLALESADKGVTVNCVAPGFIQRGEYTDNDVPRLQGKCPMKTVGTHEDISAAVAFFANPENSFVTGQVLCVDGGRSLGLYGEK